MSPKGQNEKNDFKKKKKSRTHVTKGPKWKESFQKNFGNV
jgi:hypothetical protein